MENRCNSSRLFPPLFQKADAVRTTTFTGCMGETFLDGKAIGLWNYRDRQGDCKGCAVRWRKKISRLDVASSRCFFCSLHFTESHTVEGLDPLWCHKGHGRFPQSISGFAGECKRRAEYVVFWRLVLFADVCFFQDYSIEVQPTRKVDCKFNPRILCSVKGQDNNKSPSVWFQCSQSEDLKMYFSVCSSARSDPTARGRSTWTARATQRWGDPPGGTPISPPWPSSSAPSPLKPCSCI